MHAAGEAALKRGPEPAAEDPDEQLVHAALRGDTTAFDTLVDRHWTKVAAVAGRFLDDPNEVEDAVQEAFVQAYCHLRSFRGHATVRTWLIRIVANACRSRRRSFWQRRVSVVEAPAAVEHALVDPQSLAERDLAARELDEAVHQLPERLRLPLVLYFYEDLSGPEIAAALGWNESTVWSRIYTAYRELRKRLQPAKDE
jgi:RNA polymerase sigma-70 factor (ECF subfamily)